MAASWIWLSEQLMAECRSTSLCHATEMALHAEAFQGIKHLPCCKACQ